MTDLSDLLIIIFSVSYCRYFIVLFPQFLGIHRNIRIRYLRLKVKWITTSRRTCHLVKIYENTKKESQHPFDKTKVKTVISQHEAPLNSFEGCLQRKVIDSSYVAILWSLFNADAFLVVPVVLLHWWMKAQTISFSSFPDLMIVF